jgi:hypothetical protein
MREIRVSDLADGKRQRSAVGGCLVWVGGIVRWWRRCLMRVELQVEMGSPLSCCSSRYEPGTWTIGGAEARPNVSIWQPNRTEQSL